MINIYGVNAQQKALLDTLWEMESLDEINEWISTLSGDTQTSAKLMRELISLASMDELIETEEDCCDANFLIKQFLNIN